ncbi:MAG: bacteriohemerythrin [Candidatus Poribacteria bacterium]
MALFVWDDSFSVNIKQIDEQHKKLVNILNNLHDAMKLGKGSQILGNIFAELIQYVETHFTAEERLMHTYSYNEYDSHKLIHSGLTKKVIEFQKKFQQGQNILTMEIIDFLKNWLQNHILGTDKKYGPFLNSKGVF